MLIYLPQLNPILGETFEAGFSDGTELFLEQVSHHPPISYILLYGPQKKFQMSGAFVTEATGGLNSLKVWRVEVRAAN